MVEITDEETLETWLEGKDRSIAVAIASRTALRVVPLIAELVHRQPEDHLTTLVLPVFYAIAASWANGTWANRGAVFVSYVPRVAAATATAAATASATFDAHIIAASVAASVSVTGSEAAFAAAGADTTPAVLAASAAARREGLDTASAALAAARVAGAAATAGAAASGVYDVISHASESTAHATSAAKAFDRIVIDAATAKPLIPEIWGEIRADADAIETGLQADVLMRRPLWSGNTPASVERNWAKLKADLLALDENWYVWTDWYDDRLRGAEHPDSRALIEQLELERILIPDAEWKKGPKRINAMIAALEMEYREMEYRAQVPPQRAAIIEVEHDDTDGRLHRRPSPPPEIRDAAREQRLRKLWSAHCDQLATLERLDPGRNSPGLGATMTLYRAALGSSFEAVNIIALGVHGTTIKAHAANADEYLLPDMAAVLVGLAKAHDPFIGQFDAWRNYLRDAANEPLDKAVLDKAVAAAIGVVRSMREMPEMIADDVSTPLGKLADAAERQKMNDLLRPELLRSVGNVLSGLFTNLMDYARSAVRKESLEYLERATKAILFAGTTPVLVLIAGYPAAFGWIEVVVAFLKKFFSLAM